MIYLILKPLIRLSLLVFFRKFDTVGEENLPEKGPVIYVSNHPSAVIDPLIVAVTVKPKVYFLAGAEWFGKGLKSIFFKKQLNMIPVHRPWLAKGKKVSNNDMFLECYKSLEQGKSIVLFPEASSVTVAKIRELKTGAVRIQSGFEEYMKHKSSVPIIPIGISYSNPHEFQSRVVVKVGKPVNFDGDYKGMEMPEIARAKTEILQGALKDTIVNIENDDNQQLVKQVNRLFIETYKKDKELSFKDRNDNFEYAQHVAKAIEHFETADSEGFNKISNRINKYFSELKKIGISDDIVAGSRVKLSVAKASLMIFGFPIALASLIIFAIPYQLSKLIFKKQISPKISPVEEDGVIDYSFKGSLIFSVGMIIFFLWTLVLSSALGMVTGQLLVALIAVVACYPIFRFSLYYSKIALRLRYHNKSEKLRKENKLTVDFLDHERQGIVNELKRFQSQYDSAREVVLT